MKRVSCSDLTRECDAEFHGATTNDVVVQYVMHASYSHRKQAIRIDDLLTAITSHERRRILPRQRAAVG